MTPRVQPDESPFDAKGLRRSALHQLQLLEREQAELMPPLPPAGDVKKQPERHITSFFRRSLGSLEITPIV